MSVPPETLVLRYFMPRELKALLTNNGFKVLSRYGDWEGSPLTGDSQLHNYRCCAEKMMTWID